MSTPVSLLEMSKLPMEHILKYLDYPSILVLRKVCHDLRNFIDDTKPASHLTRIDVDVNLESISLHFASSHFLISIDYEKNGEGCLIKCEKEGNKKETMVEVEDFVTVFCQDLDIVLRHQKTLLEDFEISNHSLDSTAKEIQKVLESVNKSLKSMNHRLQTKKLYMGVNNHKEILTILPYLDPKPLEHICIIQSFRKDNVVLNLDEIGQLEQWKQAEKLTIESFQVPYQVEILKHFSRIHLGHRRISIEELILLKEIFLHSTTLTRMLFAFYDIHGVISQKFIHVFGQPFFDSDQNRNWFFKIANTNQLLRIKTCCNNYIFDLAFYFDRIEQSDVPQNAVIQN